MIPVPVKDCLKRHGVDSMYRRIGAMLQAAALWWLACRPGIVWSAPAPGASSEAGPADPAAPMTDIHDIKPALPVDADLTWLWWPLVVALVLALAALVWWLWHRRNNQSAMTAAAPLISPEEEAYQRLDALAADGRMGDKKFYFQLSAILRHYVERRYDFPAAEMTTEELLPRVDRLSLPPELAQPLKRFCRTTDPIKFAGATADQSHMPRDLAFVRDFVWRTTNRQKPPDQGGPSEGQKAQKKKEEQPALPMPD